MRSNYWTDDEVPRDWHEMDENALEQLAESYLVVALRDISTVAHFK